MRLTCWNHIWLTNRLPCLVPLIERGINWGKFNGVESEPVGKADSVLRRAKGPRRWHKSIRLQRLVASQSYGLLHLQGSLPVIGIAFNHMYGIIFRGLTGQ